MWQSVICCLVAGLMMWIPGLFDVMNVWTLLVPAALFSSVPGCCFRWQPVAQWSLSHSCRHCRCAGWGLQNIGSGVLAWFSAMLPQTGQASLGLLMTLMGLLIFVCWLPLASRVSHQGQAV